MLKRLACPLTQFRQVKTPLSPHSLPITPCKGAAPFPRSVCPYTGWNISVKHMRKNSVSQMQHEEELYKSDATWSYSVKSEIKVFLPMGLFWTERAIQVISVIGTYFSGFLQPSGLFLFWWYLITHESQLQHFPWWESLSDLAQTVTKFVRIYSIWRQHLTITFSCSQQVPKLQGEEQQSEWWQGPCVP